MSSSLERTEFGGNGGYPPNQIEWLLRKPQAVIRFAAGPQNKTSHKISLEFRGISIFDETGWAWTAWDLGYHSIVKRWVWLPWSDFWGQLN